MKFINFLKKIFSIPTQNEINEYNRQIDDKLEELKINKSKKAQPPLYEIKPKYISNCEIQFGKAIKEIIGNKYIIYPQVPLSQIVIKNSNNRYQSELYRIIDFCIFSKDYRPLLCIEINDSTHHKKDRYTRDNKVKEILEKAGLPLIALWTEYGIKPDYIAKRIKEHIEL